MTKCHLYKTITEQYYYIPSAEQACILRAHYNHAATFHHLHLFQSARLQDLQDLPTNSHHNTRVNFVKDYKDEPHSGSFPALTTRFKYTSRSSRLVSLWVSVFAERVRPAFDI